MSVPAPSTPAGAAVVASVVGAALLLVAVTVAPVALAGKPVPRDEVRQRVDAILADGGYQTELPAAEPQPPAPERRRGRRGSRVGALASVVTWSLLTMGAVALVVALVFLVATLFTGGGGPRRTRSRDAVPEPPSEPPAGPSLPDPEELARRGDFGEAVHALLLHALSRLRATGLAMPPALTSREVLAAVPADAAPRRPLAELVEAVEQHLFAGRRLGAEEWRRCRRAYGELAGAEGTP